MKTSKTLHIHVEDENSFFDRAQSYWKRAETDPTIDPEMHLSFNSFTQLHAIMTTKRVELVEALRASGALSIRALAKTVSRDYKSVYQDVQKLMDLGLIKKREDGLIEAPYDRIVTDLRFTKQPQPGLDQTALLDRRRNETRKQRVRLERT